MVNTETPNPPVNPPVAPPPAAPYMQPRRPRSLAGPIVLILVGVMLTLANAGALHWGTLGVIFAKWWPALLVVWGIVKLLEHMRAQREGYASPGIGFGGVILVVFLILAGGLSTIGWKMHDQFPQIGKWGNPYNFDKDMEQPYVEGDNFRLEANNADVVIRNWDENKVRVHVKRLIYGKEQQEAQKEFDATQPTLTKEGNLVLLKSGAGGGNTPEIHIGFFDQPSEETTLEVYLPKKVTAEIQTQHGDVTVNDRESNVKIDAQHGDVVVTGVKGTLQVNSSHGDLSINRVTGNVTIDGGSGDLAAHDIDGLLTVNADRFGDVSVSRVTKGMRFTSSRTDLELGRLDGQLSMDEGDLSVGQVSNGFKVTTRSKDILLNDVTGDVTVVNAHGDVSVRARAPLGNIDISNQGSDVTVALPENAPFQIDAQSMGGDVSSSFTELQHSESGNEQSVVGNVGGGKGATVKIRNEHGDVVINRGVLSRSMDKTERNATRAGDKAEKAANKLQQKADDLQRKADETSRRLEQKGRELERHANQL